MAQEQQENVNVDRGKDAPMERAAIVMAVAVVFKRLTQLPPEDLQEVYELAKELVKAKTAEDVESIRVAMIEILDQERSGVRAFELSDRPEKLQKWVDFIAQKVQRLRK